MKLESNKLIDSLRQLNLPVEDFAIFGSGPMWAHGLREIKDLDIVARGKAWERAATLQKSEPAKTVGRVIHFAEGQIEIFDAWGPGEWDIDELIDTAEEIEGLRFVKLANVLKWKHLMAREKDADDIKLIKEYMQN